MTFTATIVWTWLILASTGPDAGSGPAGPALLDFHASWCAPCQQMRPAIETLARKGYPIRSIDVDRSKELAARYRVREVPTFVVVDADGRELARSSGLQPAKELALFFNNAVQQAPAAEVAAVSEGRDGNTEADTEDEGSSDSEAADRERIPKPWETAVRIRIFGARSVGYGSGTLIYSDEEESIVLTCAHIFHIEGAAEQPHPSRFPRKIQVDLFDGVLHGLNPAMVHPVETVAGEAVDYDFGTDVGLIRIRPGRKLPVSPVVPPDWTPKAGEKMTTVGCSEGNNATAWSTHITNPRVMGLVGKARYEAIECNHAPRQGRSGGGLYTLDGYLAGVCDFAEPQGRHGLYASPRSIYKILDRNQLTLCYNPSAGGRSRERLASANGGRPRAARAPQQTKLRAQNGSQTEYPMPAPEQLGMGLPEAGAGTRLARQRGTWQAAGRGTARGGDGATLLESRPAGQIARQSQTQPIGRTTQLGEDDLAVAPQEANHERNPAVSGELPEGAALPEEPAPRAVERSAVPKYKGGWRPLRRSGAAAASTPGS